MNLFHIHSGLGSDRIRFRFFRYQNFEAVRIFNQFRFEFGITFTDRIRFGFLNSDFLSSPIQIKKKGKMKLVRPKIIAYMHKDKA